MLCCPQLIAIMWVYGVDNFMDDVKSMLGGYPTGYYYWKFVWTYITPASVFVSINPSPPVLRVLKISQSFVGVLQRAATNASQLSPQMILLFTFIDYSPSSYSNYQFPLWADILGWCISFSCIAAVPIRAIWLMLGKSGPIKAVSSWRRYR